MFGERADFVRDRCATRPRPLCHDDKFGTLIALPTATTL
jgi:hypothetical protein